MKNNNLTLFKLILYPFVLLVAFGLIGGVVFGQTASAKEAIRKAGGNPTGAPCDANSPVLVHRGRQYLCASGYYAPSNVISVVGLGATGNGATDDTAAIQVAHDSANAGDTLYFPMPVVGYRVRGKVNITKALNIKGDNSKILFDFPYSTSTANGTLFSVQSSNVHFEGLWFDGTGLGLSNLSGNRHAIYSKGTSGAPLENVTVKRCQFTNLLQYAGSLPAVTEYSVPARFDYTHKVVFEDNYLNTIIGWGVFFEGCNDSRTINNRIYDTEMASLQYYDANTKALIQGNQIHGNGTNTRYWGASIDILSQHSGGLAINKNFIVKDNTITGKHMYGAVIRTGGIDGIEIAGNIIRDIDGSYSSICSYINMAPRGATGVDMTLRGIKNVSIHDNWLYAGGDNVVGIYIYNHSSGGTGTPYADNIKIENNHILGVSSADYFVNGIIAHGADSGIRNLLIEGNTVQVHSNANSVLGGHIYVVASGATKKVEDSTIRNNKVYYWDNAGAMDAAGSSDNGIVAGQYTNNITIEGNTVNAAKYGIYIDALAANIKNVTDNVLLNSVTAALFGTPTNSVVKAEGVGVTGVSDNAPIATAISAAGVGGEVQANTLSATTVSVPAGTSLRGKGFLNFNVGSPYLRTSTHQDGIGLCTLDFTNVLANQAVGTANGFVGSFVGRRTDLTSVSGGSWETSGKANYAGVWNNVVHRAQGSSLGTVNFVEGLGKGDAVGYNSIVYGYGGGYTTGLAGLPVVTGGEVHTLTGDKVFAATLSNNPGTGGTTYTYSSPTNEQWVGGRALYNLNRTISGGGTVSSVTPATTESTIAFSGSTWTSVSPSPVGGYIKIGSSNERYSAPCSGNDVEINGNCYGHWYRIKEVVSDTQIKIEGNYDTTNLSTSGNYLGLQGVEITGVNLDTDTLTVKSNNWTWAATETIFSPPNHFHAIVGWNVITENAFKSGLATNGGHDQLRLVANGPQRMDRAIWITGLSASVGGYRRGIVFDNTRASIGIDASSTTFTDSFIKMSQGDKIKLSTNESIYGGGDGIRVQGAATGTSLVATDGSNGSVTIYHPLASVNAFKNQAGTPWLYEVLGEVRILNSFANEGTSDLGTALRPFKYLRIYGDSSTPSSNSFRLTGTSTGGIRTITLPDATTTVAGLGVAQTFTAAQTFADDIISSVAGKSLQIKTGANACAGVATLVAGAVTVSTTCTGTLGTNRVIILTPVGSSTGTVRVSASVNDTSFTIASSDGASTDAIHWVLLKIN